MFLPLTSLLRSPSYLLEFVVFTTWGYLVQSVSTTVVPTVLSIAGPGYNIAPNVQVQFEKQKNSITYLVLLDQCY
jgi:hypothetical protein